MRTRASTAALITPVFAIDGEPQLQAIEYPPGRVGRFPALDVGNPVARRDAAAQDLVAQGFGTLGRAATQRVRAHVSASAGEARPRTAAQVGRDAGGSANAGEPPPPRDGLAMEAVTTL